MGRDVPGRGSLTPTAEGRRPQPNHPLYLLLAPALVLFAGLFADGIQGPGLLAGVLFAGWVLHARQHLPDGLWLAGTLLASLTLAAHLLPGFTPLALAQPRPFSPDAAPYGIRLHWDKLLLGATLLVWWWSGAAARPRPAVQPLRAWCCALATLLAVPALALAIGLVAWQPKWPDELMLWLVVNLGVTVLAEELLFRGLLQNMLSKRLGAACGIGLTAALFGLAHAPFSLPFALVAGIAGLGYGWVMQFSGHLSAAVLLHGTVNLVHFLLLSYPLRLG